MPRGSGNPRGAPLRVNDKPYNKPKQTKAKPAVDSFDKVTMMMNPRAGLPRHEIDAQLALIARYDADVRFRDPEVLKRTIDLSSWDSLDHERVRRLIRFKTSRIRGEGGAPVVHVDWQAIDPKQWEGSNEKGTCTISIIKAQSDSWVTSVDLMNIAECVLDTHLCTEEKNRIRRCFEDKKPKCLNPGDPFYVLLQSYNSPKPRNIDKSVKVYRAINLMAMMKKLCRSYIVTVDQRVIPTRIKFTPTAHWNKDLDAMDRERQAVHTYMESSVPDQVNGVAELSAMYPWANPVSNTSRGYDYNDTFARYSTQPTPGNLSNGHAVSPIPSTSAAPEGVRSAKGGAAYFQTSGLAPQIGSGAFDVASQNGQVYPVSWRHPAGFVGSGTRLNSYVGVDGLPHPAAQRNSRQVNESGMSRLAVNPSLWATPNQGDYHWDRMSRPGNNESYGQQDQNGIRGSAHHSNGVQSYNGAIPIPPSSHAEAFEYPSPPSSFELYRSTNHRTSSHPHNQAPFSRQA
ncbi:unnamed protein product [Cutaneotrichosporon oleaginosum]